MSAPWSGRAAPGLAACLLLEAACGDHYADVVRSRPPGAAAPTVAGCPVFPPGSPWNSDVSAERTDPLSADYVASVGAAIELRANVGPDPASGIPYHIVPGTQPKVPVSFTYAAESDAGPYPIPPELANEAGADGRGRTAIIIDSDGCLLYEIGQLVQQSDGSWRGSAGAIWNLREDGRRPLYWTSVVGSGLPIFPGLVRYDEIAAGEIRHALAFRAPSTQRGFVFPASHFASDLNDPTLPPMGLRVRLKASIDVSTFPPSLRPILRALQRYGMFLFSHGSSWSMPGAPDPRFDSADLATLRRLHGSDFEAVATGQIQR